MSGRTQLGINVTLLLAFTLLGYKQLSEYLAVQGGERPFRFGFLDLILPFLIGMFLLQTAKLVFKPKPDRIIDPAADIVIEDWAVTRLFHMLFSLVLVFAGVASLITPFDIVLAPISKIACIGLGGYGLARLVFTPKSRFVLSRTGIEYSEIYPAQIAWEDIVDVEQTVFITTPTIVLKLRETGKFRPAFLLKRWRRLSQIRLYPAYFGFDTGDLLRGIELRRAGV